MMRMELQTADFIKCKEEGRLTFISWLTKYDGWCQLMTTVCDDKAELWLCYSRVSGGERLVVMIRQIQDNYKYKCTNTNTKSQIQSRALVMLLTCIRWRKACSHDKTYTNTNTQIELQNRKYKAKLWLCYLRVSGGERLLADCDVVMLVVDVPGETQD